LSVKVFGDSTVGISTLEMDGFYMISPNPANDLINISCSKKQNYSVSIYNSIGKQIFNGSSINNSLNKIDLSSFSNGIYFVRLSNESGKSFIKKLIINH
jgi:hypothetical protein